jgi:cell filamentation protein
MFTKYEQVEIIQSIYNYEDTEILINKLDIMSDELLKKVESDLTQNRLYELYETPFNGRFSMTHLLNIHRHIFQDIYPFAGKIRVEENTKGSTRFHWCHQIKPQLKLVLSNLHEENYLVDLDDENYIKRLAFYMSELNLIHPFREGNGRAIREFVRELAIKSGRMIDWQRVSSNRLLDGAIRAVDFDYSVLEECLREVIE